MAATFTKLDTGAWGVRCDFNIRAGFVVEVKKKDGSMTSVRLGRLVESRGGVSVFEVKKPENTGYQIPGTKRAETCAQCGRATMGSKVCLDIHGIKGRVCAACAKLSPSDRSFS